MRFSKQIFRSAVFVFGVVMLFSSFANESIVAEVSNEFNETDRIEVLIPEEFKSTEVYDLKKKDTYTVQNLHFDKIGGDIEVVLDKNGKILQITAPNSVDKSFFVNHMNVLNLDPDGFEECVKERRCGGGLGGSICKIVCAIENL